LRLAVYHLWVETGTGTWLAGTGLGGTPSESFVKPTVSAGSRASRSFAAVVAALFDLFHDLGNKGW
jgi:hypothetical protein